MEFEPVIGLEVHVQLATQSKMFSAAEVSFGKEANFNIDPLTLGLPGSLPVINKKAVQFAIILGLALSCEIKKFNRFARKHYFYPDLPKGYQLSQYEEPICERGQLQVTFENGLRTIGITRIHIEEDAGKNIHDPRTQTTLIDLNRAGVPLLEIVSEPDLRSPTEAAAYLRALRQLCRYLAISNCDMEQGEFRCDANISLRPVGEIKFGTRTEIKNLNSFRFVERAIEYEIARQASIIKSGGKIIQETVLFDPETGTTKSMRSKEEAADYRYFPCPDLPPLIIEDVWINQLREKMPILPWQAKKRLLETFSLSPYDADLLTSEREYLDYFEGVVAICENGKLAANWICSELFGFLNKHGLPLDKSPITADKLGELLKLVNSGEISGKIAKQVFEEMFASGENPSAIIERLNLKQINDPAEITKIIKKILEAKNEQVVEYKNSDPRIQQKIKTFFIGQIMKETAGKANPVAVNQILETLLNQDK
ncbi:MAG TPA: Asp-tRNA(Asn)/Glu-tRNA(Gln) amidotransferase subunit GatB [Oligoflexia bacterium]|nr:Asp-tRNA(Asn)/Glu-tRNA(Gln) amidotransferase subunit GatB [Oligoflexia bacterium]HMP27522.1 Asp-tRNA(Asn)/Glu-tRNA(Gln) amidotransferase subunit GatB [Oligoflexia bacterium]